MKRLASSLAIAALTLTAGIGAARAQDIVVASAGPMTGQYATFGEQLRRGS